MELSKAYPELRVPNLALGIRPRGPNIFPKTFSFGNISGVENSLSNGVFPF